MWNSTDGDLQQVVVEEQPVEQSNGFIRDSTEDEERLVRSRMLTSSLEMAAEEECPQASTSRGTGKRRKQNGAEPADLNQEDKQFLLQIHRYRYQRLQQKNKQLKISKQPEVKHPQKQNSVLKSKLAAGSRGTKFTFDFQDSPDVTRGNFQLGALDELHSTVLATYTVGYYVYPDVRSNGITRFDCLGMTPLKSFLLHTEPIRDLALNGEKDILLTVGLDRKVILTDINNYSPVQSVVMDYPIWSCTWDTVTHKTYYVGGCDGEVLAYDLRYGNKPFLEYFIPTVDSTGVDRLKFISPQYHKGAFKKTGLLIEKQSSIWFYSMDKEASTVEPKFQKLPLEGSFQNLNYDPYSGMSLISTRGSVELDGKSIHRTCVLKDKYSKVLRGCEVSCDVIYTLETEGDGALMSRPVIFSLEDGTIAVVANIGENCVEISDALSDDQQTVMVSDNILDFVAGKINSQPLVAMISNSNVRLYNCKQYSSAN